MRNQVKNRTLANSVDNFVIEWTKFSIDLWWRKRYNIPFGSPQHRAMNFIDMAIEYREMLMWNKSLNQSREEDMEDEEEMYIDKQLRDSQNETLKLTKEEIDSDYENLILEDFDKKE